MHVYFDTNPLMRWAEAQVPAPEPRPAKIGLEVEKILGDSTNTCAVSEITLIEFFNNVCIYWRQNEPNKKQYNRAWVVAVQGAFMKWIAEGRLMVLPIYPRLFERAIIYVEAATAEHKSSLRSWDAAHLCSALEWAMALGERVQLVTNNGDMSKFIALYPEFSSSIELYDPDL